MGRGRHRAGRFLARAWTALALSGLFISPALTAAERAETVPQNPLGLPEASAPPADMSGYYVIENTLYYYDQTSGEFVNLGKAGEEDRKGAPGAGTGAKTQTAAPQEIPDRTARPERPSAPSRPVISLDRGGGPPAAAAPAEPPRVLSCRSYRNPLLPGKLFPEIGLCQLTLLEKLDAIDEILQDERTNLEDDTGRPAPLERSGLRQAVGRAAAQGCACAFYID